MELVLREDGALLFGETIVGRYDAEGQTLVLNLGWTKMTDLKVLVYGDPEEDRRRIVLER